MGTQPVRADCHDGVKKSTFSLIFRHFGTPQPVIRHYNTDPCTFFHGSFAATFTQSNFASMKKPIWAATQTCRDPLGRKFDRLCVRSSSEHCQLFLALFQQISFAIRVARFFLIQYTKTGKNITTYQ
jgi:hypothetical protein